jgi:hypothetical protein
MLKNFKTNSPELKSKVVVTTNTQNKISSRDLHSNDPIQKDIQRAFRDLFSISYERKPNEFENLPSAEQHRVVSNEKVGQAYFAVVLKRPSDARRRKYLVWGDEYDRVFHGSVLPATYLLVYRIVEACNLWKRPVYKALAETDIARAVLANGVLHVARAASFLWRGGDDWNDSAQIERERRTLEDDPNTMDGKFQDGLGIVKGIIEEDEAFTKDIGTTLKSGRLDDEIDKRLYK